MALETQPYPPAAGPWAEGLHALRKNWGWLVVLGIALIVLGVLAVGAAFIATLATVTAFGILILIGGGVQLATAIWAGRWSGFFLHLLAGILYLIVGMLMIEHPVEAAAGITLMIAALFMVGGLFRIIVSLSERFHNWGWVLLNGIITLLLGILIWRQWPESSFWVIGLFIGIEMIFNGWAWVMLGLMVRAVPRPMS
jgi:uncharacterized membrane protein HdeD (DUF308 family)